MNPKPSPNSNPSNSNPSNSNPSNSNPSNSNPSNSNPPNSNKPRQYDNHPQRREFRHRVRRKLARHKKAEREKTELFYGLGVFGVVGWSVAIPTLLGIALGIWIDETWPSPYSWTLMMLFVGVILGCLNAWFWIESSHRGD